ncbi:hypothetical protein ILUMI_25921 [Ignelater luminosus]|uniref:Uncharacterized protein n=1 Tax=Ignelater luminosus TaxID=2038154 RepID=A0A8K0C4A3_IGNLU|nr:hypothetical protein ILUMI_25921 [Ignelater luminosus]
MADLSEQRLTRIALWETLKCICGFKEDEMSIDDQPRSGRPLTSRTDENVEKVRAIVRRRLRNSVRQKFVASIAFKANSGYLWVDWDGIIS